MRQYIVRLALLIAAVLVIFGIYRLVTIRPLPPSAFFTSQPGQVLRIADTSSSTEIPPYSLAALEAARAAGADGFYLPVQLMPDGRLVALGLSGEAQPSALGEILAAFPQMRVIVDLQEPTLRSEAALLQAVEVAGAQDRTLVIVDDQALVEVLRQQAPDLTTAYTGAETDAFLATARAGLAPFYRPAAPALILRASQLNQRLVRAAQSRGVGVVAIAGGSADSEALSQIGVDAIISSHP
jgi:glycerophosphoryl diester phosphodiesterase